MNSEDLIEKAKTIMQRRFKLRVQRNNRNMATGEVTPGKIECGWMILNLQGDVATLDREGSLQIFHAKIQHLFELNKGIFEAV